MSIFGKGRKSNPISCEDVVAAYGEVLQKHPMGGVELPYDVELIKAALVKRAQELNAPQALEAAKAGFVALNGFVGRVRQMDLASVAEEKLHALLDGELDGLEREFEDRLALARRFARA